MDVKVLIQAAKPYVTRRATGIMLLFLFFRWWYKHTTYTKKSLPTNAPTKRDQSPPKIRKKKSLRPETGLEEQQRRLAFLASTKYVACLGEQHFQELYPKLTKRALKGGEVLFKKGDRVITPGMYILSHGRLGLYHASHDTIPLCHLDVGDSVDEISLIANEVAPIYRAECRAERDDTQVYFLSRPAFESFITAHPESMVEFVRTAIARQWRVVSFVLDSFLELPPRSREQVQGNEKAAYVGMLDIPSPPISPLSESSDSSPSLHDSLSPHIYSIDSSINLYPRKVMLDVDDTLFEIGDDADCMYVLQSGCLCGIRMDGDEQVIAGRIPAGSVVGGISFFGGTTRGETVRASEDSVLYEYSRECFEAILKTDPSRLLPIARAVARQLSPPCQQFFELGLRTAWHHSGQVIFLEQQSATDMYLIISGRVRALAKASNISKHNHTTLPIYQAQIPNEEEMKKDPRTSTSAPLQDDLGSFLFEVGRGETFGEHALMSDENSKKSPLRTYTAICVRECELVRISQYAFMHIFEQHPKAMLRFNRTISERLQHLTSISTSTQRAKHRTYQNLATIAVVHVGSYSKTQSYRLSAFTARLTSALSAFGPTLRIDSHTIDRVFGEGTTSHLDRFIPRSRVARWLTEQEEANRFVIFQSDVHAHPSDIAVSRPTSISSWTKLCIAQADAVLLVGSWYEGVDPSISPLEHELLWSNTSDTNHITQKRAFDAADMDTTHHMDDVADYVDIGRHKDLILLHPDSPEYQLPHNTRAWLHNRRVRSHHHLRRGNESHYQRLARFLAGETVGIVLSGGGARGLAHLGVLQALEENQVPIDYIAGSSQGAFMSALYAMHLSTTSMRPVVETFASNFGTWSLLKELTLPILSYFDGRGFSRTVKVALGEETQIEDLWLPYFCITTNIMQTDMSIHTTGDLWRYCRASMTVMGLLPPLIDWNGDILVDGGYVNNLPVDVMAQHAQTVLACDVEDKDMSNFHNIYNYGDGVSGFWLLYQKYFGSHRILNFTQVLLWLSCINHSRQLKQMTEANVIDLYIRPPIEEYGLLDYSRMKEIVRAGYLHGIQCLNDWQCTVPTPSPPSPPSSIPHIPSEVHIQRSYTEPEYEKRRIRRNPSMAMLRQIHTGYTHNDHSSVDHSRATIQRVMTACVPLSSYIENDTSPELRSSGPNSGYNSRKSLVTYGSIHSSLGSKTSSQTSSHTSSPKTLHTHPSTSTSPPSLARAETTRILGHDT